MATDAWKQSSRFGLAHRIAIPSVARSMLGPVRCLSRGSVLGLVLAPLPILLPIAVPAHAEAQALPPDTVTTVFVSDTIADFGAVGGVAVDAAGYVYIADFRNAVWRLSPEGGLSKFADGLYGASGIAVGPRGNVFQSSYHGNYLSRISRTGVVETWVDEGLNGVRPSRSDGLPERHHLGRPW